MSIDRLSMSGRIEAQRSALLQGDRARRSGGGSRPVTHGRPQHVPRRSHDRWFLRWFKWTFCPPHAGRTLEIWRRLDVKPAQVEPKRIVRARNAALSVVRRPPSSGPVWAVSMVRNEADIVEETVRNLFSQGVDHVVIADNGSTDGTIDILRSLSLELPLHVVTDPVVPLWQGEKLSHLARAATRMGAAWIVPFDGDELWKGTDGKTTAQVLRTSQADFVTATWWDFMPLSCGTGTTYAERHPYRESRPRPQVKVAFRANWLARIWIGSHHVTVPRPTRHDQTLRIAHFQFRTPAQMLRKANEGAGAARLAGERAEDLPQWFEMEGATEEQASRHLRRLVDEKSVVHDPATSW